MSDCKGLRVLDAASTTCDPFVQAHCPDCAENAQLRAHLAQAVALAGWARKARALLQDIDSDGRGEMRLGYWDRCSELLAEISLAAIPDVPNDVHDDKRTCP